ncbi:telomere cap complex subunit Stn1 [Schizosaccharomyces japonicus yFS275]|uniref:Telomere cap complex subunit Stn1 n=1 Tax=Schizosaccharomyces japonicus (strain yFS275 / FY16936) TaxID=402676 RepID=B6K295_SCHJY|nr:telomere cap complex subunit Stn1 [Schizosaccharomyces japonicus yFS275]EEB07276.1 telomere cap complex subunit Stn1 [Schizosaccharomyces japonicus yFS275]
MNTSAVNALVKACPTLTKWIPIFISDLYTLVRKPGVEEVLFWYRLPVIWLRIVGIVMSVDEYEGRTNVTVDDASGRTIVCCIDQTTNIPWTREDRSSWIGKAFRIDGRLQCIGLNRRFLANKAVELEHPDAEWRAWQTRVRYKKKILDRYVLPMFQSLSTSTHTKADRTPFENLCRCLLHILRLPEYADLSAAFTAARLLEFIEAKNIQLPQLPVFNVDTGMTEWKGSNNTLVISYALDALVRRGRLVIIHSLAYTLVTPAHIRPILTPFRHLPSFDVRDVMEALIDKRPSFRTITKSALVKLIQAILQGDTYSWQLIDKTRWVRRESR